MNIRDRVEKLRQLMKENQMDAYIIPSFDAHQSEYVAEHWKCRQWISGFTGSAGTVVITLEEQLFAAGYAACFHGSLMLLAGYRGIAAGRVEVAVTVAFGRDPSDGLFMLSSHVRVRMPSISRIAAAELVRDAERVCPYAKMARQGIESIVTLIEHGE